MKTSLSVSYLACGHMSKLAALEENSVQHTPLCGKIHRISVRWNIELANSEGVGVDIGLTNLNCRHFAWPIIFNFHLMPTHTLTERDVLHYPMAGQLITRTDTSAGRQVRR